jgi:hypothetical protein
MRYHKSDLISTANFQVRKRDPVPACSVILDFKGVCVCSKRGQGHPSLPNARLDVHGGTTFNGAQLGTYYVVLEVRLKGQHYLWNIRVDMKQGTTVVTLEPGNASPLIR